VVYSILSIRIIKQCHCNRDFAVADIRMIVKQLRQSVGLNSLELFSKSNCKLDDKDRTLYECFTEELNLMIKNNINCPGSNLN
jgi:hypothetical protein